MHYYRDLGNGHLQEIIGGEIPADAIESAEPIVFIPPVVPVAEPYVPTAAELLQQAKNNKLWQIQADLDQLDKYLPRGLEDFWTATAFNTTSLPQVQQDRLARKVVLREKHGAVEAAVSVAEFEALSW